MTWIAQDAAAEGRFRALDELPRDASAQARLLEALADDSWRVRRLAADRLALLPASRTLVGELLRVLADRSQHGARNAAALALSQLGTASVPALLELLATADADQRKFAADILGEVENPWAVSGLVEALRDADANVRVAAAEALGRVGGAEAVRALDGLLDSPDPLLRICGLEGLARLKASCALPRLVPLLAEPLTRRSAYRVLGHIEHPAAFGLVCQALRRRETRDAALIALAARGTPLPNDVEADARAVLSRMEDRVAWLTNALGADPERRLGALLAVHATADDALAAAVAEAACAGECAELCLEVLLRLGLAAVRRLLDGHPPPLVTLSREARAVVGEFVLRLAEPSLVGRLVELMQLGDAELAELAVRALGRTGATTAIAPLVQCFADDALAAHAFRALVQLASSWEQEVRAQLEPVLALELLPHAVRAWASIAKADSLPVLRRALHDEQESVRAAAAESAPQVPAEAASLLSAALMDESPRVRRAAARAVGALPLEDGLPLVRRVLADTEPSVLALACLAAAELGAQELTPRLAELVHSPDPAVALSALQALVLLGVLDDEVLRFAANHPDPEVLKQALTVGADRPAIVDRALEALLDARWDVRVAAARALAVAGPRSALSALAAAVEREADPLARELLEAAHATLAKR